MNPAAFIDTNIPIYAAGRDHPLKRPCSEILAMVADRSEAFVTSAEVLQELLHRYLSLRIWSQGREVMEHFSDIMLDRIEGVEAGDVRRAAELADAGLQLSGKDLVHAAVMERLGVRYVVTADADFDRVPNVERLDPASFATWRTEILATQA